MVVVLRREDALCLLKRNVGINQISTGLRRIQPHSDVGDIVYYIEYIYIYYVYLLYIYIY